MAEFSWQGDKPQQRSVLLDNSFCVGANTNFGKIQFLSSCETDANSRRYSFSSVGLACPLARPSSTESLRYLFSATGTESFPLQTQPTKIKMNCHRCKGRVHVQLINSPQNYPTHHNICVLTVLTSLTHTPSHVSLVQNISLIILQSLTTNFFPQR